MAKKNYFLQIFFIFLSLFSIFKLYDNAINLDAWQYGEWLINYQHGFVRRGLIGEIIFLISDIFNINIQIIFLLIISIFSFLYYFFSYKLIKNLEFNFIHYLIIFSPLFYLFFIVISKVGVKKEMLLYLFYVFYLIYLTSSNFKLSRNWIYYFIYILLLFNHEAVFFYLPYIFVPLLFIIKKEDYKKLVIQILTLLFICSIIILALYFNKGSFDHSLTICKSLGIYAPMKCDWWGPIYALSHDLHVNIENQPNLFFYLSADIKTNLYFIFYIFYSIIPILIFLNFSILNYSKIIINKPTLIYFCLFTFLFSLHLFHIAEDWSRWFSIHIHLISFLIFFMYKRKIVLTKKINKFNKINNYLLKKNIKNYFFIVLFVYATSFHHHHFYFEGVKLEFTYLKIYKKIENIYKKK